MTVLQGTSGNGDPLCSPFSLSLRKKELDPVKTRAKHDCGLFPCLSFRGSLFYHKLKLKDEKVQMNRL